jgi:hypothetical protein
MAPPSSGVMAHSRLGSNLPSQIHDRGLRAGLAIAESAVALVKVGSWQTLRGVRRISGEYSGDQEVVEVPLASDVTSLQTLLTKAVKAVTVLDYHSLHSAA